MAKRSDPNYIQVNGYIHKDVALRFKIYCTANQLTISEALEEAMELLMKSSKDRIVPLQKPQCIAELVKLHYYQLSKANIKNIEALSEGKKPQKADLARIASILNLDFAELQAMGTQENSDIMPSKPREKQSNGCT